MLTACPRTSESKCKGMILPKLAKNAERAELEGWNRPSATQGRGGQGVPGGVRGVRGCAGVGGEHRGGSGWERVEGGPPISLQKSKHSCSYVGVSHVEGGACVCGVCAVVGRVGCVSKQGWTELVTTACASAQQVLT